MVAPTKTVRGFCGSFKLFFKNLECIFAGLMGKPPHARRGRLACGGHPRSLDFLRENLASLAAGTRGL